MLRGWEAESPGDACAKPGKFQRDLGCPNPLADGKALVIVPSAVQLNRRRNHLVPHLLLRPGAAAGQVAGRGRCLLDCPDPLDLMNGL
jgi:hypothetical protein